LDHLLFDEKFCYLNVLRHVYDEPFLTRDNEDKTFIFFLVIMFSWQICTQRFYLLREGEVQNAFWLTKYNPTMIIWTPNLSYCVSKFLRQCLAVSTLGPQP
jgi:hypothetical protein